MSGATATYNEQTAIVLAIETSQRNGSVAVRAEGQVHTEVLQSKTRHDDDLLPAIDRLLSKRSLKPTDLTHVAVSIGPGGFTGLRIATATVKMFAETLGVKIAAVPSAMSVAFGYQGEGPIAVALASKNETFWWSRFRRDNNGAWSFDNEPHLADAQTIDLGGLKALVADEFLPAAMVEKCNRNQVPIINPQFAAAHCLAAGLRLFGAGIIIDPVELSPIYARDPEAVLIWESKRQIRKKEDSQRS